jgi:hypothetical protein
MGVVRQVESHLSKINPSPRLTTIYFFAIIIKSSSPQLAFSGRHNSQRLESEHSEYFRFLGAERDSATIAELRGEQPLAPRSRVIAKELCNPEAKKK